LYVPYAIRIAAQAYRSKPLNDNDGYLTQKNSPSKKETQVDINVL